MVLMKLQEGFEFAGPAAAVSLRDSVDYCALIPLEHFIMISEEICKCLEQAQWRTVQDCYCVQYIFVRKFCDFEYN
jgi:hypothetical protein